MRLSAASLRLGLFGALAVAAWTGCGDSRCKQAGEICRVAGTGSTGFNGDGKPALESDLYQPSMARVAPDGRVVVMDFNNHRLRVIDADGTLRTLAGNGDHALAKPGPALSTGLENPVDFAFAPDGRIIFVSIHDPRVLALFPDGELSVLAGNGAFLDAGDFGPAPSASFLSLSGVAVAPDGSIFVADAEAHRVRVIRPTGIIEPFAGVGTAGHSGDAGPATQAQLANPRGLALGPDGALFIACTHAHAIRRVAADGVISTVAGIGVPGFFGDGGPADAAAFSSPEGVVVAPDGRVFISDSANHRVRVKGGDGVIRTLAGTGKRGDTGDGGPAERATLDNPTGLSWTPEGDLLVADLLNSVVRRIQRPAP